MRVATGEVGLEVYVRQFRNTLERFESKLLSVLKKRTDRVEIMAVQMWESGMSQANIATMFKKDFGVANMSERVVRVLCQELKKRYEQFSGQDLSKQEVVYLFLDGIYLPMWRGQRTKEAVLVALGIMRGGRKVLFGLATGPRESTESWRSFLSGLVARGLKAPLLCIRDNNAGLIRAVNEILPYTGQQVCVAHKMRTLVDKMPSNLADELRLRTYNALYAKDYATALKLAKQIVKDYQGKAEAFVKCFEKDLYEMLAYLRFPQNHWRAIRTTNIIERRFGEVKRRTKVIPRFQNETSCLMLCFAVLIEDMKRAPWRGLKTTREEDALLENLGRALLVEKKELRKVA